MSLSMKTTKVIFEFEVLNSDDSPLANPKTSDIISSLLVIISQLDGVDKTMLRYFRHNDVVVSVIATHNLDGIKEALDILSEVYNG